MIARAADAGAVTVTVALAFLVVSAALVAVTVTLLLLETVGAVNRPLLEMDPAVADQVTDVLVAPCTEAANCCVPPELTVADVGETATLMAAAGALTFTAALAFFVVSAALVAVMVTLVLLVTLGAVNRPLLEMDPAVADQVTDVLVAPCTEAVNCCVAPELTVADDGETDTLTLGAGALTATVALAFLVASAALVAVTVTFVLLVTLGAVNNPSAETVPAVADHVTAVLLVPETLAEKRSLLPDATLEVRGETVRLMVEVDDELAMTIWARARTEAPLESVTRTLKLLVPAS
ncbi:MAG TPA: hypothetical protein VFB00_05260 [Terriglobales bacterium]|nr:hypothetical protein [Terriglobales bacterium]